MVWLLIGAGKGGGHKLFCRMALGADSTLGGQSADGGRAVNLDQSSGGRSMPVATRYNTMPVRL